MTLAGQILRGTSGGVFASTLVHAALAGTLYFALVLHRPAPIVAELDLSMAPLVPSVPNPGGGSGRPSEVWTAPKKGLAPAPIAPPSPVETTREEVSKADDIVPCPEPCAQTGDGTGGGGTGEGQGQYVPVEQTAKKPRWVKNFITSRDYPAIAKQQGKDGRVVLSVLIDSDGRVRDARLLEGSYEIFNEVALRKVKDAVFTPAYDANNRAVSCKVTLPIRFELR